MEVLNTIIVHLDLNAFHNYIYLTVSAQHHMILVLYILHTVSLPIIFIGVLVYDLKYVFQYASIGI